MHGGSVTEGEPGRYGALRRTGVRLLTAGERLRLQSEGSHLQQGWALPLASASRAAGFAWRASGHGSAKSGASFAAQRSGGSRGPSSWRGRGAEPPPCFPVATLLDHWGTAARMQREATGGAG